MNTFDLAMSVFVGWQLVWSLVAFLAVWHDKSLATAHRWRISEDRLHRYEFWGGWLGSGLAQQLWRHKTSKESYQRVYKRTALVWLITSVVILGIWMVARLNA
ncbi:DUF1294 domain-containing protein [Deinococcus sp. QL22]|uniref:DUF1294 domain-containing protein n=1 Tax=Deinococcus sp. QL22 TaxID=2939437 RepID=UPI0020183759|nr:DUF1294 domain-containing protein [Deinococcus sp. QL22]UQN06003.1 DUF1294 domain-containing protein [Deinococcus sp. QL22]